MNAYCASRIPNCLGESEINGVLRGARYLPYSNSMKDIVLIVIHIAVTTAILFGPGGVRALVAENLLLRQLCAVPDGVLRI